MKNNVLPYSHFSTSVAYYIRAFYSSAVQNNFLASPFILY